MSRLNKQLHQSLFGTPREDISKPWTHTVETQHKLALELSQATAKAPRVLDRSKPKEKYAGHNGARLGRFEVNVGSQRDLPIPFDSVPRPKGKHWMPKLIITTETKTEVRGKRIKTRRLKEKFKI